jgi:hypothetical protein
MLRTTLLHLFTLLLATALLSLLWGKETERGPRGALRNATALVVLLLMLRPLSSLVKWEPTGEFPFGENAASLEEHYRLIFEAALANRGEADLINGLHDLLYATYGIEVKDAVISVRFGTEDTLEFIRVTLGGRALLQDPRLIQADLENRFQCTVEVR